jgi:transcriptional regulator with XRE-family HTH domain
VAPAIHMWDNRTMSRKAAVTQADLGRRIADARTESGMTQADLAASVGLERTALVRIEMGERKVSATELVAIAGTLDRPVDWFFTESPAAVVSRRSDLAVGGFSRALDHALELAARDVAFLEGRIRRRRASRMPRTLPAAYVWKHGDRTARYWIFSRLRRTWGCWDSPSRLVPMPVTPHTSR